MDEVGKYTLEIMSRAGWYNNWIFEFIKPHLKGKILEVGAGIGNFTTLLTQKGVVTAIDLDRTYVYSLKKRLGKKVVVGFGDVEKGKYFFTKSAKFDTIVCLNVLEHIKSDKKVLQNMYSQLTPGGKLILLVPAHKMLYSDFDKNLGHFRRYNKNALNDILFRVGFRTVSIRYFNWLASIGWLIFLTLTGWQKIPGREVGIFNFLGKFLLWPEKHIKFPFGLSVLAIAEK
jgi:SAM-dependent methyltransferase